MKQGGLFFVGFVLMLSFVSPLIAESSGVNFQTYIFDTFDAADASEWGWNAVGSKFVAEGFPKIKYTKGMPRTLQAMQDDPNKEYGVFGTEVKFDRKGDNWMDIYPTKEGKPFEVPFKGKVARVDMWVWGGGYYYNLEMLVRDIYGRVHTLPLGSLKFKGWENMYVRVPSSIPQASSYSGDNLSLKFVGFRVRTAPWERVDDFYIFFDNFKVLTNVHFDTYDGYELAKTQFEEDSTPSENADTEGE